MARAVWGGGRDTASKTYLMISRRSTQFRDKAELLSNFPINWPAIVISPYQSGLLGHDLIPPDIFLYNSHNLWDYIFCFFHVCIGCNIASPETRRSHYHLRWGHIGTLDCNWPLSSYWRRESGTRDRWCCANVQHVMTWGAAIFTFTTLDIITGIMILTNTLDTWTLIAKLGTKSAKVYFILLLKSSI